MSDWQPIETAPLNVEVLVYFSQFATMRVLRQAATCLWTDEDDAVYAEPTHWMPLPDPPKEAA